MTGTGAAPAAWRFEERSRGTGAIDCAPVKARFPEDLKGQIDRSIAARGGSLRQENGVRLRGPLEVKGDSFAGAWEVQRRRAIDPLDGRRKGIGADRVGERAVWDAVEGRPPVGRDVPRVGP